MITADETRAALRSLRQEPTAEQLATAALVDREIHSVLPPAELATMVREANDQRRPSCRLRIRDPERIPARSFKSPPPSAALPPVTGE